MGWFGWSRKEAILIKQAAHREHYPVRDMYSNARRVLKEEGKLDKAYKEFKDGMRNHLVKEVVEGGKEFEVAMSEIHDELNHIGGDTVAVFHFTIKSLIELIKEMDEIKGQVPSIEAYREKAIKELQEMIQLANGLGQAFESTGKSG